MDVDANEPSRVIEGRQVVEAGAQRLIGWSIALRHQRIPERARVTSEEVEIAKRPLLR